MQPSDDIGAVIQSTNSASPYIVGTGTDILHLDQFFIVCESVPQPFQLTSFRTALVVLIACHYVLNIEYPAQTQVLCKFLEKFCLGLNNLKKLSPSAVGIISAIEKQTV